MPITQNIAGFTRYRRHQVGVQTVLATAVPATRVLPYRGAIVINPNRTDPDVDVGSLDPVMPPFLGATEVSGEWTGKLDYDNLPIILALAGKGGVTPTGGGAAKTWTFQYGSLTADSFDVVTDEWGDDTNANDGITAYGGVIDEYTISFGEDLGACDITANLTYAGATMATPRTSALTIATTQKWVYGGSMKMYIDTAAGSIGSTQFTDAVHTASIRWQNNLDKKRFANGSNSQQRLAAFGRGPRVIEAQIQFAKTSAVMAEAARLDDDPAPTSYLDFVFSSNEFVTGSTPYSWDRKMPARLISRSDGEIGGNTTLTLTYRAFYDTTTTYACKDVVVNALTALP